MAEMLMFSVIVLGKPLPFTAEEMEAALRAAVALLYPKPEKDSDIRIELEEFAGDLKPRPE